MNRFLILLAVLFAFQTGHSQDAKPPVRVAMIGLVHDHAYGFIPLTQTHHDAQLAGIVESDPELIARYARRYKLDTNIFFPTLDALLAKTNIDAVAIFTTTFDHQRVVEMCAPRHLTIMMEKPLAVDLSAARAIAAAAKSNNVQVIVNYETTWYPGNQAAYKMFVEDHAFGELRKMVAHDGHRGPREIGCSETFLKWLTDPVLNGGGALPDFGCYGAGLMTWFMGGARPTSVFAVTQHIKPEVYPKVEDEASVVLTYPKAQGIIQASWNWPYNRKDLEVYGVTGCAWVTRDLLHTRNGDAQPIDIKSTVQPGDQLGYLVSVVRGEFQPSGPSSLAVNLVATEILDAARESAKTGKRIELPAHPPY